MAKVRLGFADVALARPLTWALMKGEHAETFNTAVLPHRRVAPLLAEGALDVGLVTELECEQHILQPLPDLGVVLVPGGDAARLSWIAINHTAPAMAQECPGCEQIAAAVAADSERATEGFALSNLELSLGQQIDDPLENEEREEPSRTTLRDSVDLAQSYFERFAMEPVAYVWAHRAGFDARSAEFALKSSLRFGLNGLSALSRELAAELQMSAALVENTLRAGVRYVRPARSTP